MERTKRLLVIMLNILIPIIGMISFIKLAPLVIHFFSPFIVAWLIACVANPVVRFLEKRVRLGRKHGSALIIVFVLFIIFLLLYLLISWFWMLLGRIIEVLPGLYESILEEIELRKSDFNTLLEMLSPRRREIFREYIGGMNQNIKTSIGKIAMPTALLAGDIVKAISSGFVYLIITILAAYFFTVEMNKIRSFIRKHTPKSLEKYRELVKKDLLHLIRGYFAAQLKILFVVACILSVGLLILRVRFALPLALLISLLDFLPIFGTGTVMIPWALLKLVSGEYMYAGGLLILYIATQAIRQLIQPKLVGDSMGMPALYTLLCLFVGFRLAGIGGMVVAIPLGMAVMKLYEYGFFENIFYHIGLLKKETDEFLKKYKQSEKTEK
ncbi:MAG: sporulation integral membrane protein YtvI [Johnsonella sp.]|nr:sporulation integral membrane protein YtvI [Johnsonella sp.]